MSMTQFPNLISKFINYSKYYIGRIISETGARIDAVGSRFSDDIAYIQVFSRHRKISSINQVFPQISDSYIAENASVLGDVRISSYSTIGYNVVLRAEISPIRIGNYVTIGDGCTFNTWYTTPDGVPSSIYIGNNCIIQPGCVISSCIIDDNVLIGSRSVICEGVKIGKGAIIAPNSYLSPNSYIPEGQMWGGNPVKLIKDLTEEEKYSTYINSYENWSSVQEKINSEDKITEQLKSDRNTELSEYIEQNYFKWRAKHRL